MVNTDNKKEITHTKMKKSKVITFFIFIFFILIMIILNILKTFETETIWKEENFGDINIKTETVEQEKIPENIFDAYGLEYEYKKIPSLGFSTYIPIGWDILFENEYLYFISPEDADEKYKNIEIAFCVTNANNIKNKQELYYVSDYTQSNLRNHNNNHPFVISTVDNNQYTELYDYSKPRYIVSSDYSYQEYEEKPENATVIEDGFKFIGYYCNPSCTFIYEDNPIKSNWSPYCIFYQLNCGYKNGTTLFAAVDGKRNSSLQIEEIGKTIAYNTNDYTNTNFDYNNSFQNINLKKVNLNNMFFRIKDTSDSDIESSNMGVNGNLSSNPFSLAFNSFITIKSARLEEKSYEQYFDEEKMHSIWISSNEFVMKNFTDVNNGKLSTKPTFNILKEEYSYLFNKKCKKVTWNVNISYGSDSRNYFNSLMPSEFCTYLIPDGNDIYLYTISYNVYQKYMAQQYFEKTIQLSGFEEN